MKDNLSIKTELKGLASTIWESWKFGCGVMGLLYWVIKLLMKVG